MAALAGTQKFLAEIQQIFSELLTVTSVNHHIQNTFSEIKKFLAEIQN